MKIAEYEAGGWERYERLAMAVHAILKEAADGTGAARVQQIQHRVKDAASLRKKMAGRGVADSDELEASIKDLAGCRIILYTNADVSRLLASSAIHGNFEVDWDRTKIHYPFDDTDADQLFVSYNYVLKLADRHITPERGDLRDMYCEVQVQTILDHAWSEMAHDTIYKRPAAGFGTQRLEAIRKRMTEIMSKYLLPAGFDFQKISQDVAELRAAQELNERNPLKLLTEARSNVERLELLQSFEELMLPHYDDRASLAPTIRSVLMSVAVAARTDGVAEGGGDAEEEEVYRYATPTTVVDKVCDLLDALRFLDEPSVTSTFDCLLKLFRDADNDDQRKRVLASADHLAEHNLHIWQARGPLIQRLLMDRIATLSEDDLTGARRLVVETLENILKPDVSATTSSFDVMTFHSGAVAPSAALDDIRQAATQRLEGLFDDPATDDERRRLIQALHAGTRVASQGDTKAKMYAMVLRTTARFVRFFTERWTGLSFELRQTVEHKILWLYKHRTTAGGFRRNREVKAALHTLRDAIAAFRDLTDLDADYVVFKTLVGFDEVLAPYWDGDPFDKTFREAEVDRLAKEVDEESLPRWRTLIERCAASQSIDGAYFIYFSRLLREFAGQKPELAMTLLQHPIAHLDGFLEDLLHGLEVGPRSGDAMRLVDRWIEEGNYLPAIARYQWRGQVFDINRLTRTFEVAAMVEERQAIFTCLRSAGERVLDHSSLLQLVMLPAITELAKLNAPRWVEGVAFSKGGLKAMETLSADEARTVLLALLLSPDVPHWAEEILARIAKRYPQQFVAFLGWRLEAEQHEKRQRSYEALPFEFHVLPDHMAGLADLVVDAARVWFETGGDLFRFRGGAAVARLFPVTANIEPALSRYIGGANRSDIDFVVNVLMSYFDGASATSVICKGIVAALPAGDDLLSEVGIIIEQSGMLSGAFGGVGAKQSKRDHMRTWLDDKREKVRRFAEVQIRDLERAMAADQRRSMEDLQLRKRKWGEA